MSEQRYLLAIDNGTQSVRALLFDLAGNLVGKGKVELEPYYSEHPGWAEQDPEYYWRSLGEACRQLWASVDIDKSQIAGVALTTQRGTLIKVDGPAHKAWFKQVDGEGNSQTATAFSWEKTDRADALRKAAKLK